MEFCVFSKHLQDYDFAKLGPAVKEIGVEAVDLTVRPNGHVLPEEVKDRLPEAVSTLKAEGVSVAMITTAILAADEPHTRDILETAAAQGIKFYKLGYYKYEGFGTLRNALAEIKAKLCGIAAMAKDLGIRAGYHNHSGNNIGALPLHVKELIADTDPEAMCAYFDIGHAAVEGAASGWLQGFDDLADRIHMLALKDLQVGPTAKDGVKVAAMGEGLVQWEKYIPALKTIENQIGPASFHCEYRKPSAEVVQLGKRDKAFFDGMWKSSS